MNPLATSLADTLALLPYDFEVEIESKTGTAAYVDTAGNFLKDDEAKRIYLADFNLTTEVVLPDQPKPATSTWQPVDMASVREITEEATILVRQDGVGLLYRGRIHWIQGESESHKTWILLIAIIQVLAQGGSVTFVDFEDHPHAIKSRLIALGAKEEDINNPARFTYLRPDEPLGPQTDTPQLADLYAALETTKPALVVIDGVSESMTLEGLDPNKTPDTVEWIHRIAKRVAATDSNPAVAVIDHQSKSDSNGWAIGSQHKKAGTDGAAYEVKAIRKLARAYGTEPVEALISIRIQKDRVGYVRGHSRGDQAATIQMTAWPDEGVTYVVTTNAIAQDHGLRLQIASYLDGAEGAAKRDLRNIGGKGEVIDQAIAGMITDGYVQMTIEGNAHRHYLTDAGREKYLEEDTE